MGNNFPYASIKTIHDMTLFGSMRMLCGTDIIPHNISSIQNEYEKYQKDFMEYRYGPPNR